ncbi:MAG: hypothetical protein ABS49_00200 [Erythrobacter sp. SCN 62-14]|nr:MAG: hypothetical protein ABS49_00200 [Erythrobacter sp. SCN 62-14]
MLARSPLEAQFQLVFGTQRHWNEGPQGLDVTAFLVREMAVTPVPARFERRHARGLGQMQVDHWEEREAVLPDRLQAWLEDEAGEGSGRKSAQATSRHRQAVSAKRTLW